MTARYAFRPSTAVSSNRMTPSHHGGPDPDALIRIRGRLAAHLEHLASEFALWENWPDPTTREWVRTFVVLMTPSNELVSEHP